MAVWWRHCALVHTSRILPKKLSVFSIYFFELILLISGVFQKSWCESSLYSNNNVVKLRIYNVFLVFIVIIQFSFSSQQIFIHLNFSFQSQRTTASLDSWRTCKLFLPRKGWCHSSARWWVSPHLCSAGSRTARSWNRVMSTSSPEPTRWVSSHTCNLSILLQVSCEVLYRLRPLLYGNWKIWM